MLSTKNSGVSGFWLNHLLVEHDDPKIFDRFPVRYVVDFSDLLIMITLVYFSIIAIKEAEEEGRLR